MLNNDREPDRVMITLGIDFGTTNSVVSYYNINTKKVDIITEIPTILFFNPFEQCILYGDDAKDAVSSTHFQSFLNNGIFHMKRLIGKTCITDDIAPFFKNNHIEIKDDQIYFNVIHNNNECIYSISEIVFLFMKQLVERCILFFSNSDRVTFNSVITVPAYYNDNQREFMKHICNTLNIPVIRILNEPTSASLAYGLDPVLNTTPAIEEYIFTLDSGGGTTDLSYLHMDYESQIYQVKNVLGDNVLGGEDITFLLYKYVVNKLNLHLTKPRHVHYVHQECERIKKVLSTTTEANFLIELGETFHSLTITRTQFLECTRPFFKKIRELIYALIRDIQTSSKIKPKIIFMGGTTRIPYFKTIFKEILGNDITICDSIDPDLTVSIGASLNGALMSQLLQEEQDILLLDIIPLSLGIETTGGLMTPIVSRNSLLPITKTHTFTNSDDYEDTIIISIYQGERRFVKDNFFLTSFELNGLNTYPKNSLLIHVTFDINLDNIITASAKIHPNKNSLHEPTEDVQFSITKIEFKQNTPLNIQDILLQSELHKLSDSEDAHKIILKIELYDSFKHLLSVFHENIQIIQTQGEFIMSQLNQLFNTIFDIISNYNEFSCEDLTHAKNSFEEEWHKLVFSIEPIFKDANGQLIDISSTDIS